MSVLTFRDLPSPNHDDRPVGTVIDTLVLHYTGMVDTKAALDVLRDPARKVSSHYVVGVDGVVFGFLDYNEELKYFDKAVMPLLRQAGLRR